MNNNIPSTFDNFKQRELAMGTETCSTTEYKGHTIFMRAYYGSGIYWKVSKLINGKWTKLKRRHYNFMLPEDLLQEAKDYIDGKKFQ